jgi:hypothetical protein
VGFNFNSWKKPMGPDIDIKLNGEEAVYQAHVTEINYMPGKLLPI